MAKIGYIRVSKDDQNTARQEKLLADCDKAFIEKISGKNTNRPQLKAMLEYVREGDVVVVESYSRLARNTRELLNLVDQLNSKGVAFVSLKEQTDTGTPQGKLIMTIFAGLAQFEREQILQRTNEGVAIAKAAGKYKGRQPARIDWGEFGRLYDLWKAGKITAKKMMTKLNLSSPTFYRRVADFEKGRLPF